jgi:mRNA interferase MazF
MCIVNRGDVFYANLGFDGTSRQGGIRPIVVVSNQQCNRYSSIVSVVCLSTSKTKRKLPTHINLLAKETGLSKDSICLCEQPMSISKNDLLGFITSLGDKHMRMVDDGLRCQLGL